MSIPKNVLQYSYSLSNLSSATFYDFARAPMELKFQDSQGWKLTEIWRELRIWNLSDSRQKKI